MRAINQIMRIYYLLSNFIMLTCAQVIPNLTYTNTTSEEDYDGASGNDYVIDAETISQYFPKCLQSTLRATSTARTLTSYDVAENITIGGFTYSKTWVIAPTTPGAKVTVVVREISENYLFSTSCYDVIWSTAVWNYSANVRSWCKKDSLLSCKESDKMYFYFGMNILQSPPYRALQITQNMIYDPTGYFKINYYECGGTVGTGFISSPSFPPDDDIGDVRCTWHLRIPQKTDYGILKMEEFHLPSCENHKLVIMEDTLIPEDEITDEILLKLKEKSIRTKRDTYSDYYNESSGSYEHYYPGEVTTEPRDLENNTEDYELELTTHSYYSKPILEFYREDPSDNSSRSGIHAVLMNTYCGANSMKKPLYWRKGSKNISLSYVSTAMKKRDEGFRLSFTVFSWRTHLDGHPKHSIKRKVLKKVKKKTILEDWPNYIGVMLFLPLGFVIGLSIIIVHVVRSGPSLKDFYKKERKESIRRKRAMSVPEVNIREVAEGRTYVPENLRRFSARRFESFRDSFRKYKQGEAVRTKTILPLNARIKDGINKSNRTATHIVTAQCDNNGNIV